MGIYKKSPFSFDGCEICVAGRKAESAGRSLSEDELKVAFRAQEKKTGAKSSPRTNSDKAPRKGNANGS